MITVSQLDEIAKQREEWENTTYKQSNKELYAILGRCVDIYYDMEGMTEGKLKERRKLNSKLDDLGIKYTESTKLITKIIRYVFKSDRKRSYAYSRVCEEAINSKIDGMTLPKWVEDNGGVEEIRRSTNGATTVEQRKDKLQKSGDYLKSAPALAGSVATTDDLRPSNEGSYSFCAALVRSNANGTSDIVFSTTNQTVIKALLTHAAKKFSDKLDYTKDNKKENELRTARKKAVAKAI